MGLHNGGYEIVVAIGNGEKIQNFGGNGQKISLNNIFQGLEPTISIKLHIIL